MRAQQTHNADSIESALQRLQDTAASGGNVLAELMEVVKICTLGEVSRSLYAVGGRYRRNM